MPSCRRCQRFQPTPATADGRDLEAANKILDPWKFQPTPAIADGRDMFLDGRMLLEPLFQPTPAIADGRDGVWARGPSQIQGFNPRPPLLTGETEGYVLVALDLAVSTHARHC